MSTEMKQRDEVAERFARDTDHHQMTVLRDDGLYRHLRFVRVAPNPKTGEPERSPFYWFDLVTWPGWLTITGDCGTFVFSRIEDMFGFFRGDRINPDYWGEKVQGEVRLKRYSEDRFRQHVMDIASGREEEYPGLAAAATEKFFGELAEYNTEYEQDARRALDDFGFGDKYDAVCHCGEQRKGLADYDAARAWLADHSAQKGYTGHRANQIRTVDGFRFTDTWEWDLRDWDWQFLWCCHAIRWSIAQYDKASKAAALWAASGTAPFPAAPLSSVPRGPAPPCRWWCR